MGTSAIVATVGGASSNSYCTLAEADQYQDDRTPSGTTWSGETDANKNRALLFAATLLESCVIWTGIVKTDTQSLQWPRAGMVAKNNVYPLDDDVVPEELKHAQAEFARQILADVDRTNDNPVETQGITSLSAGSVSLTFSENQAIKMVPDLCFLYLPQWWVESIRGRSSATRVLVRGY
tara:strand:+ start:490 stop:1026 length:537 start_codon:yes stop_codon:yes gene_type:complete